MTEEKMAFVQNRTPIRFLKGSLASCYLFLQDSEHGYGYGYGYVIACGFGFPSGDGYGDGNGYGYGLEYGDGYGDGYGFCFANGDGVGFLDRHRHGEIDRVEIGGGNGFYAE